MVGAKRALEYNSSTSELPSFPEENFERPSDRALDIFDFLQYAFGFQVYILRRCEPVMLYMISKSYFLSFETVRM